MFRDVLYARMSFDRRGLEEGVTDQLADTEALSLATGGRVVARLVDNDVSAFLGGPRPKYDVLLAMVANGEADRVIVTRTSRLWRNRPERAAGIDHFGKARVSVKACRGPELDMAHSAGRMLAGILGEFDTADSEVKAELVTRAGERRAKEGRANGKELFGWTRQYRHDANGKRIGWDDVENPVQAELVREIVRRLNGGDRPRQIAQDFEKREELNPRGVTRWREVTIKYLAIRPANIGQLIRHRGRPDEEMLPAAWPAIVDLDEHDAVCRLLATAGGERGPARPQARRHLLSHGIGECDECNGVLMVVKMGKARTFSYQCLAKACVQRNEARVDEYVQDVIVERIRRPDIADLLEGDHAERELLQRKAQGIRGRLAQAGTRWAKEEITDEQMDAITAELKSQLKTTLTRLERASGSAHIKLVTAMIDAPDAALATAVWQEYSLFQKRAVLDILVERIRITRVHRRGPGFDPRTVQLDWRGKH